MKKCLRKIICGVTVISLINVNVVLAQEQEKGKEPEYYQAISEFVGRSISELKELERKNGDLEKFLGLEVNATMAADSSSNPYQPMSSSQWKTMMNASQKGDVLITRDNGKGGITYGHAGIVYKDNAITVEHLGGASLSTAVNYETWKSHYTMRVYYPSEAAIGKRYNAGNYAFNNLQGKPYQEYPAKDNPNKVNCATLVWQAYNSQGINLPITGLNSCTPLVFVTSGKFTLRKGVNWPGSASTWK